MVPFPAMAPSVDQQAANTAMQNVNRIWSQMQGAFAQLSAFIWADTTQTQARVALFGNQAATLFGLASAYSTMVETMTGVAVPSPVPSGWTVTINADGTVTLTPPAS